MFKRGDGNGLVFKGARHPCVEVQDGVAFIANDVEMERGECSFFFFFSALKFLVMMACMPWWNCGKVY
jgi:hypothetical protein